MFDSAADFRYTTGADIDADHPHGDLDRIRLQGILPMPDRGSQDDPLYGKDIAVLREAATERLNISELLASPPPPFTRKLSLSQIKAIYAALYSAARRDLILDKNRMYWLSPNLRPVETRYGDVTSITPGGLDYLCGLPRWLDPVPYSNPFTSSPEALRRENVEYLFDMVSDMTQFVYSIGEEELMPTATVRDDGAYPYGGGGLSNGNFYKSYVAYEAKFGDKDQDYPLIGYETSWDYEAVANSGDVWRMPTPQCLVDKTKEVWALLGCSVDQQIVYNPSGPEKKGTPGQTSQMMDKWVGRLVKCSTASSQAVVSGGFLYVPVSDVKDYVQALINQTGSWRWTIPPNPPQGWLRSGWQHIGCSVLAVYPIWKPSVNPYWDN